MPHPDDLEALKAERDAADRAYNDALTRLDQAIQRVGEELAYAHPELCDELRLVNLELRAGKARSDALHNLADRTGVEDLVSLVGMLVQTDKFGTSVAQSLRPYPQYLSVQSLFAGYGRSWYDALQAKLERRWGGYQLLANYT